MRVLFLTTSFPSRAGGIQSPFLLSLAQALIQKDVAVDVLCPASWSVHGSHSIEKVHVHRFHYLWPRQLETLTEGGGIPSHLSRSFFAWIQFFFLIVAMFFSLLSYLRKHEVDVIHSHWSLPGLIAGIAKVFTGVPVVVTERGAALNIAIANPFMRPLLRLAYALADGLATNSNSQGEIIRAFQRKPVQIIPNGVDATIFRMRDKRSTRKKIGISSEDKVVLFVGWLIPRKNADLLIRAMKELVKKIPRAHLFIIGDGVLRGRLQSLVREFGSSSSVHFLGNKDRGDVGLYMGAADALVLPSFSEGRANVLMEALSCGTPVIASNISGNKELIQHGKNGLLFDPNNQSELVECLFRVLGNQRFSHQMKARLASGKMLFGGWDECAHQYIRVYREVTASVQ